MPTIQSPTFGALLRRFRAAAGLTQEELAERAQMSSRSVSDIERGISRSPQKATVERLAAALKLPTADQVKLEAACGRSADGLAIHSIGQDLPTGAYLGSLPSGPLVTREVELAAILAVVEEVIQGEGRLIMLSGEPGVGKTRLAQEATIILRERGFLIATGRCYEPEQSVGYYPFLDALATVYIAAPTSIQSAASDNWPYLARLIPEHIRGASSYTWGARHAVEPLAARAAARDEQQRLFRAVTGFLDAITVNMPVALMMDDLHWADTASLKLLLHLARHTRTSRLLLLGTYRDVEVGRWPALEQALLDLRREHLLEHVVVRRLAVEGTAALVAATLGETRVSWQLAQIVHGPTDGNPFFVEQVVRSMVERGDVYREDGIWQGRDSTEIEVPETVRSVIGWRLSRLSRQTREILREASVLGQSFNFGDLEALGGHPETQVDEALCEATARGIVRMARDEAYIFDHALTHQTLYSQLSPRRKRRLHRAAGQTLETLPERVRGKRSPELAWHFLQAGEDQRALEWAMAAGDRAQNLFACDEAERHYRTALDLARELGNVSREAEALEKLGSALTSLLQLDEALKTLEVAATSYSAIRDLEGEGRAVAQLGRVHFLRGTEQEGIARVQPTLRGLADFGPSAALARLYLALADLFHGLSRGDEELSVAEEAAKIAHMIGDDWTFAVTEGLRARALLSMRRLDDAVWALKKVIPLQEAVGNLTGLCAALVDMSWVHDARGELSQARAYLERALGVARRTADPALTDWVIKALGWNAFLTGNWSEAHACADELDANLEPYRVNRKSADVLLLRAMLALHEGQWEEACRYLREAELTAEHTYNIVQGVQFDLALLDLMEMHPKAALARLERIVGDVDLADRVIFLPTLAEAHLKAGTCVQAEEIAAIAVERAAAAGDRRTLADGLRVVGLLRTRQRCWTEAARALEEALAVTRSMGAPWYEARLLYDYGDLYAAQGKLSEARGQFQEALDIFERLGAKKDIARIASRGL